ncbi:hypothetical protein H6775_01215 [Candidatus Nomurabacteria bacterium]|nr:hypothetical protein [Candidatus Nomurabacteria bacterium]
MSNKQYKILNQEEKDKSELVVTVELDQKFIDQFRDASIKDFKADIEMDGFRKGQVPDKMIIEKVGEMAILEKSAYKALNNIIPMIIVQEKINALTQPAISITKIAQGSPLEFKMTVTLMPEINLPDYKKIAKDVAQVKEVKVEEKEIEEYLDYIRTQRRDAIAMSKNEKIDAKTPLPELDDDFVKTLGNFKDVEDFKKQLKENVQQDKELKEKQKRRLDIMEKVITETKVNVPDVLIEQEVENMLHKFKHDIENMKMKYEDYLNAIKKTEEDLKKEWKTDAEKRVKMNLILPKIAETEKLKAKDEDVAHEVKHLKEHNPEVDENHATIYVGNVLTNEEVFKFLEEIS